MHKGVTSWQDMGDPAVKKGSRHIQRGVWNVLFAGARAFSLMLAEWKEINGWYIRTAGEVDPMQLPASQSKDKAQLLRLARVVLGVHDSQAAWFKKPEFDVYCTTCCGACSYRAGGDEGSSLQRSLHIPSSRLVLTKPCPDGRILLKFAWYSECANITNIWAILT